MTAKVPYETVQYQSHHHCQCDFCNSRRTVNEKKFGVSQTLKQLNSIRHLTNCCCPCHELLTSGPPNAAPSFELDDPEHHVNQTALNASNGRVGVPGGDKYTTFVPSTRRTNPNATDTRTTEEMERDAMAELDRLERLLILEHKARVNATMDTDAAKIRQETGKGPRPIPFQPSAQQNTFGAGTATHGATAPHSIASPTPSQPHADPTQPQAVSANTGINGEGTEAVGKSGRRNYYGPRPEGAGVVWRKIKPSMPDDVTAAPGGLGNSDNRDLWKSTLVKGSTVKKGTASLNGNGSGNGNGNGSQIKTASGEKLPPGACAAMRQQEGDNGPIPTVRENEEL